MIHMKVEMSEEENNTPLHKKYIAKTAFPHKDCSMITKLFVFQ
jgi:hypothetical protein